MDLRKIKTLIDLVSESNVAELEITESEGTVRIVKSQPLNQPNQVHYVNAPAQQPNTIITAPVVAASAPVAAALADAPPLTTSSNHILKAPMVGTFYNAPSPEAKPFVVVGDTIKQGQTICIIEAMKILNEIEADKSGVIVKMLAENAQGVEFGQPLFEIA